MDQFLGLFMNHLKNFSEAARSIPFFCSPFMADEQLLGNIAFPEANLNTIAPWATTLSNAANKELMSTLQSEKNKTANIFHLLGWEAAFAVERMLAEKNIASLDGWSFESPRGTVTFHPETHSAYAPLHQGRIAAGDNGNCTLIIQQEVPVTAEMHRENHFAHPVGEYSRWKNNFFCI